jgi:hypothetical protein
MASDKKMFADEREMARCFLDIARSPEMYLQAVSADLTKAFFLRIPEVKDFAERIQGGGPEIAIDLEGVLNIFKNAEKPKPNPLKFIFMTDYCMSTVLINMLAELKGTHTVCEPKVYATLSIARRRLGWDCAPERLQKWKEVLALANGLMARSYHPPETVIVKEWPLSNCIINDILASSFDTSAVFLYSDLKTYLSSALKRPDRRKLFKERVTTIFNEYDRYPALAGVRPSVLTDAQMAALHWLVQMYTLARVNKESPDRPLKSLNCDTFAERPRLVFEALARHLGLSPTAQEIEKVMAGPSFNTYSKPDDKNLRGAKFDNEARKSRLQNAQESYSSEVNEGLKWADEIVSKDPFFDRLPPALEILSQD